MRPDASTTRSAATLPVVPRTSSNRTPATRLLSGEAITSVTRERCLISICGSCSTRRRQTRSSAGRDRANWSYPKSRCGKGSKPGSSNAEVAAKPHPDGAGLHEIDLDPRKHTVERGMPAREQRVRMARLRRAGTRSRSVGQGVAVEHRHLLEMGLDRLRRRQPRHSGADDDGLLEDWIAHFGYLQR